MPNVVFWLIVCLEEPYHWTRSNNLNEINESAGRENWGLGAPRTLSVPFLFPASGISLLRFTTACLHILIWYEYRDTYMNRYADELQLADLTKAPCSHVNTFSFSLHMSRGENSVCSAREPSSSVDQLNTEMAKFISSDRSSYSDSVLLDTYMRYSFLRFQAFLPIYKGCL